MQEEQIHIDISELRRAVTAVLDHVESVSGTFVPLPVDYFWSVPAPEIYDPQNRPDNLTLGQITESWDNLKHLRAGDGDTAISYAAVWLGEVLSAIGHNVIR